MADQTELRMNLAAVKRTDPYAAEIVETSAHVAFYTFNYEDNEWEKTDVEGAFFVYRRTAEPFHSIFINNRLNTESLVEPITADLELQAQPPFLLYRNERSRIRGFWFYNKDELQRVAGLVNKLVKECQNKQQQQQQPPQPQPNMILVPHNSFKVNGPGGPMNGHPQPQQQHAPPMKINPPVNIFTMLSKAQDDFDNSNNPVMKLMPPQQQQQPQQPPPMDNSNMLAALLPKMSVNGGGAPPGGKDAVTSQSVMNFFASAKPTISQPQQQQLQQHPAPPPPVLLHSNGQSSGNGGMRVTSPAPPPMLQRLMSNPVTTVEQIEMQHRAVTPQEGRPKQQQQKEEKPQQPVSKENGFNWKGGSDAAKSSNGTEEMWPALNKGNKGKSEEKTAPPAAVVAATNGSARKGQTPKSQGGGGGAGGAAPKPALMTPTMFKKSESKVDPTNPSLIATKRDTAVAAAAATKTKSSAVAAVDLAIKPEPLTQSQMLQAMTYLMKTDGEFMKKLHEAYVKSFAEMMAP